MAFWNGMDSLLSEWATVLMVCRFIYDTLQSMDCNQINKRTFSTQLLQGSKTSMQNNVVFVPFSTFFRSVCNSLARSRIKASLSFPLLFCAKPPGEPSRCSKVRREGLGVVSSVELARTLLYNYLLSCFRITEARPFDGESEPSPVLQNYLSTIRCRS
jgi:hypothetical protein